MRTATAALGRLASRRARMVLSTFTAELVTGVLTGVLTGVATTAAIRFPGATVMAVTGFLGAGLLTFPQAIGVVVLANAPPRRPAGS